MSKEAPVPSGTSFETPAAQAPQDERGVLEASIRPDAQGEGGGMGHPPRTCASDRWKTDVKEPAPSGRSFWGSSLKGDRGVAREAVGLDCIYLLEPVRPSRTVLSGGQARRVCSSRSARKLRCRSLEQGRGQPGVSLGLSPDGCEPFCETVPRSHLLRRLASAPLGEQD